MNELRSLITVGVCSNSWNVVNVHTDVMETNAKTCEKRLLFIRFKMNKKMCLNTLASLVWMGDEGSVCVSRGGGIYLSTVTVESVRPVTRDLNEWTCWSTRLNYSCPYKEQFIGAQQSIRESCPGVTRLGHGARFTPASVPRLATLIHDWYRVITAPRHIINTTPCSTVVAAALLVEIWGER